jgi:hypothetical protein
MKLWKDTFIFAPSNFENKVLTFNISSFSSRVINGPNAYGLAYGSSNIYVDALTGSFYFVTVDI